MIYFADLCIYIIINVLKDIYNQRKEDILCSDMDCVQSAHANDIPLDFWVGYIGNRETPEML